MRYLNNKTILARILFWKVNVLFGVFRAGTKVFISGNLLFYFLQFDNAKYDIKGTLKGT
jgi:hypothetical protein